MMKQFLAVDSNINNYDRHKSNWQKHGIQPVRVSSMQEAIEKLSEDDFIFIGINGDSINYKSSLGILRDNTLAPIIIFTSQFTFEQQIEAIRLGADHCLVRRVDSEETTAWSIVMFQRYMDTLNRAKKPSKFLSYSNVFVCPHYMKVFVKDMEISLTRKEFDLLCLLISHPKRVFTYKQILRRVWGAEYGDGDSAILWSEIKRLRKKLKSVPDIPDYIKTVRDVGYTFDG